MDIWTYYDEVASETVADRIVREILRADPKLPAGAALVQRNVIKTKLKDMLLKIVLPALAGNLRPA